MFYKKLVLFIYHIYTVFNVNFCISLNNVNQTNLENFILIAFKIDQNYDDILNLAKNHHYRLIEEIHGFKNVFLFEKIQLFKNNDDKRSAKSTLTSSSSLPFETDNRVLWTSSQKSLKRDKRDFIYFDSYDDDDDSNNGYYYNDNDIYFMNQYYKSKPIFNDELWQKQWYMQTSTLNQTKHEMLNLNVLPVYARGITGKNVRVVVLDDGLEYEHEDLIQNYDPEISYDCVNDIPDPRPNYSTKNLNHHGTRCAGEIAMTANNKKCGVGIAFNAKIGCIKLLDGNSFDLYEGKALGYAYDKIDIYSSSWGPTDNGETLEKPGQFALYALERGVTYGRNGLGSIYVWAGGNGGSKGDNCNCDGYATSIYTIIVGSVTQHGKMPWYSERCASTLTVTYSSGNSKDQMIATTDLGNSCTVRHTGTSASAPLAAGIIALGLEVNPTLTWRDVQHIIIQTSEYKPLINNDGWIENGAGLFYNTGVGFGLMNAEKFVTKSLNWKRVPKKYIEKVHGHIAFYNNNTTTDRAIIKFKYKRNLIKYLEHVEINVNILNLIRGNLEIYLKSPNCGNDNECSIPILQKRKYDKSNEGFINWTFMSVATWYENPYGVWEMEIIDNINKKFNQSHLKIGNCTLILHGTNKDSRRN